MAVGQRCVGHIARLTSRDEARLLAIGETLLGGRPCELFCGAAAILPTAALKRAEWGVQ